MFPNIIASASSKRKRTLLATCHSKTLTNFKLIKRKLHPAPSKAIRHHKFIFNTIRHNNLQLFYAIRVTFAFIALILRMFTRKLDFLLRYAWASSKIFEYSFFVALTSIDLPTLKREKLILTGILIRLGISKFCSMLKLISFLLHCATKITHWNVNVKGIGRDSNPQFSEPQSDALFQFGYLSRLCLVTRQQTCYRQSLRNQPQQQSCQQSPQQPQAQACYSPLQWPWERLLQEQVSSSYSLSLKLFQLSTNQMMFLLPTGFAEWTLTFTFRIS